MNYKILCIGKIKDDFYKREIASLCKKIKKENHILEILEYPDLKIPNNLKEKNKEEFIEKEDIKIFDKISNSDYVIALCIEGKEIGTTKHLEYINQAKDHGYQSITYVIGGSLGLSNRIKERANLKLSFSKMTFPHQMMRMILCEEIYQIIQLNRKSHL